MEENQITGEQPNMQMTQNSQDETATQDRQKEVAEVDKAEVENGNLGSLGKFKDANSLLDAYNNLQAEFTKKCQALSQATQKLADEELSRDNFDVDNKTLQEEVLPIYKRNDWTQRVSDFLENNQLAKPYARQIAETILQDENLAKNESALDIAFAKTVASSAVLPEAMVEDDEFVSNYVLKSEKIKNAVLQLYLEEIKSNKTPNLMGVENSSKQVLYGTKQATSLSQAKEIVKQMLS